MLRRPRAEEYVRIPYTLALCFCGDHVLLLNRQRPPFAGYYNGLGGKISPGESALESAQRELLEECIDLTPSQVRSLRYVGPAIWYVPESSSWLGMHFFALRVKSMFARTRQSAFSDEGPLVWVPLRDLAWPMGVHAVPNIPTLAREALAERAMPHAIALLPTADGRFAAESVRLRNGLPWPTTADPIDKRHIAELGDF